MALFTTAATSRLLLLLLLLLLAIHLAVALAVTGLARPGTVAGVAGGAVRRWLV